MRSHRALIQIFDLLLHRFFFSSVQVIEEIEEMMQDSPDAEEERNPSQSDLSMLSVDIRRSSPGFEDSEWPLQRAKNGGLFSQAALAQYVRV